MNALLKQLKDWDACKEGYKFSEASGATTLAELWPLLQRPDWMLWLTDKAGVKLDESKLRLFACDCAEQVLPLFERDYPKDKRPRQAIEVARRYANGQATDKERDATWAAARAAAGAATGDAARAYQADKLRSYFPNPFDCAHEEEKK